MSTFKQLGFKTTETLCNYRAWTANPFYGITAFLTKHPQTDWSVVITVDSDVANAQVSTFKTRAAACNFVSKLGHGKVILQNALSGLDFETTRDTARRAGICPSMESYYCI